MKQFTIDIYAADPRAGARPCGKLLLGASTAEAVLALAIEMLADFSWKQLDAREAPCHKV
jgi:hypothetical protein